MVSRRAKTVEDENGSDGMSPFALIVTRGSRGAPQPRPPSLRLQTAATSRHSRSHAAQL